MVNRNKYGFTLIELLIVVAIIGILAAIAVPNFLNAQLKAKIAKVYAEERSVNDAYQMYFMDNNGWPPHLDGDTAQHRFVTTPIAYLSTSLTDPFQVEGFTDAATIGWYKYQYHVEPNYQMLSEFFGIGDPSARRYAESNRNASFFTRSVGPDMDVGGERSLPYEASNGLMSHGAIFTPIPGTRSSVYPYARR